MDKKLPFGVLQIRISSLEYINHSFKCFVKDFLDGCKRNLKGMIFYFIGAENLLNSI